MRTIGTFSWNTPIQAMARVGTVTSTGTRNKNDFLLHPTHRTPHRSIGHWIEGRAIDGGVPRHLWRIHNDFYDLAKFAVEHPGGKQWIECTQGTDITEAFECSHPNPNTHKMLKQFLVTRPPNSSIPPRLSPISFKPNGFYKTLQAKVWEDVLKNQKKGPTKQSKVIADCLCISFISLLTLSAYFSSFFLAFCAGIALNYLVGAGHNFFHQRDSFRMYYFDLSMFSMSDWRVSHALSHHLFPNSIMDLEVSGLDPFFVLLPICPKHAWQRVLIPIYCHAVFLFAMPIEYIRKVVLLLSGQAKFELSMLLIFVQMVPFYLFGSSLILWGAIHVFTSWFFIMTTLVFGAHHHEHAWHQGDKLLADSSDGTVDFGMLQMEATLDRVELVHPSGKPGGGMSPQFFRTCSFGDHVLHHLFPTVDAVRLPLLYPAFKDVCFHFGIRADVHHYSCFRAGLGFFRQLYRTCINPSKLETLKVAESGDSKKLYR